MNTLVANERENFKKSALKKLRDNGKVPAIVYGRNINTKSISIGNKDLLKVTRNVGRHGIISLDLDGKSKNVILRDYQNNPVTRELLHVDFLQVDKHTEIDTKVSVILKGTSKGEKVGGVANQYLHELDILAKANDIPNEIEIDITNFEIGDVVRIADIKKDYPNCTVNHEDEETIMMIDYGRVKAEEEEDTNTAEVSDI